MKTSTYMDRALQSRDPRFSRILGKLGHAPTYERRDLVAEPDDLSALREEYHSKTGKKAYHGWDVATLRDKIAKAENVK